MNFFKIIKNIFIFIIPKIKIKPLLFIIIIKFGFKIPLFIFFNLIIILFLFFFLTKVLIIIHEFGHIFIGKILNFKIHRVHFGSGTEISRINCNGTPVIFFSNFSSGLVWGSLDNYFFYKFKLMLFSLGGIIFHIIIFLITIFFANVNNFTLEKFTFDSFLLILMVANIHLLISSLLPIKYKIDNYTISSDSLRIFQILFNKKEKLIEENTITDQFFIFLNFIEGDNLNQAENIIDKLIKLYPDNSSFLSYKLLVLYRQERYDDIYTMAMEFEDQKRLQSDLGQQMITNLKCWLSIFDKKYFSKNDLDNLISILSIQPNKELKHAFTGTIGSVYICNNNLYEGIKILTKEINLLNYKKGDATHAYALTYGLLLQNNIELAEKYFSFAKKYELKENNEKNAIDCLKNKINKLQIIKIN